MPILEAKDLTYTYSIGSPFEKTAVDHINLQIEQGEFVGIIGHTGSGKSTLMQMMNGLLKPTAGTVLLDGKDIWEKDADRRSVRFQVGLVFQYPEYQLFEETVYKDIAFGPKNMGLDEKEIDRRVRETAEAVGLREELLEKAPYALSGGQKRRVAIAGVMAMEPRVLILDEPTAGLDPKGRTKILSQLREYHKRTGCTVMLVSHSMEDVAKYVSRLLVLSHAKVVCYDTPANVFARGDELEKMGLALPQITRVFRLLRDRGITFPDEVYTVNYGAELLRARLEGRAPQC
ncbi:MAG: energy-coupling factor transporter ATPase [Oscillospiraceae bacterium]|nr:energy-coupling factor transporter ATPase [Oscillospiraceae bacterium]